LRGPDRHHFACLDPERDTRRTEVPANTLKEAIAYAKERPGSSITPRRSALIRTSDMLALTAAAGIRMVHLPSKGAGETLPALLRGEAHITESNVASNIGAIRAGQIKAYAVTPSAAFPSCPKCRRSPNRFSGIGSLNWNGVFAPVRTPRPSSTSCLPAIVAVMKEPRCRTSWSSVRYRWR
jgi:tripartite-type tricarboxylate transporter receptor subunit TctC